MNISVCMATYCGEKFVLEQIKSILAQLASDDEIIVVDDSSNDNTVKLLRDLNESRIKIYVNDRNIGINNSFGRAISLASNDIIFMSDQDDIWIKDRIALMVKKFFDTGSLLISSNMEFIDINGNKIYCQVDGVKSSDSCKHFSNIVDIFIGKTNYFGCAMAFRKEMVKLILPIPSFVESHDLWIALAGNLLGSNEHLDEKTLLKRIHNNNATTTTSNRNLLLKIWSRVIFVRSIVVLLLRAKLLCKI